MDRHLAVADGGGRLAQGGEAGAGAAQGLDQAREGQAAGAAARLPAVAG